MEERLRAFLKKEAGVAAVIGERIYPDVLPEKCTLPAVTYQRIDTPRTPVHGERSTHPRPRVQLRIWGKTRKAVKEAADAVRETLDGYRGTMGGTTICRSIVINEHDDYDPETGLRSVIQDYQITYLD